MFSLGKAKENSTLLDSTLVDHSKKIIAEVETGDIVIFHSWVVHGSEENILKSERYAITFTYQPGKDTSHHRSGPAELIEPKAIYK